MAISTEFIRDIRRSGIGETFQRPARRGGTYTVRTQFRLDASNVLSGMNEWESDVLKRTGGFIRIVIQRSMKKGRETHKRRRGRSGRPPLQWDGLLKRLVVFDTDLRKSTVSWGVAEVKTTSQSAKGIPRTLEEGGSARVDVIQGDRNEWSLVRKRVKYRKFPYIAPQKQRAVDFMKQVISEEQL